MERDWNMVTLVLSVLSLPGVREEGKTFAYTVAVHNTDHTDTISWGSAYNRVYSYLEPISNHVSWESPWLSVRCFGNLAKRQHRAETRKSAKSTFLEETPDNGVEKASKRRSHPRAVISLRRLDSQNDQKVKSPKKK